MAGGAGVKLRVEGVAKAFGSGHARVEALRGVDVDVRAGEMVLVMGPSGSGKTTLLSIMGALLHPDAGRVVVGESDVTALSERKLPAVRIRHLGFVFQDFNLLSALTARENVEAVLGFARVPRREAKRRAEELLRELGLGERLAFLPEQLSGGEKQRVAIARALANGPEVLLCDEPTANLDSRAGRDVVERLRGAADRHGASVVIVSHDQRIRELADRVLWLEDGRLARPLDGQVETVCGAPEER
ncbi:MAG: ABC transporter ATP-binding protein [Coriobacteriia bacterium]|nr:ABC transporter ATP-binding protein [Coriobacteriia bacterium]